MSNDQSDMHVNKLRHEINQRYEIGDISLHERFSLLQLLWNRTSPPARDVKDA